MILHLTLIISTIYRDTHDVAETTLTIDNSTDSQVLIKIKRPPYQAPLIMNHTNKPLGLTYYVSFLFF